MQRGAAGLVFSSPGCALPLVSRRGGEMVDKYNRARTAQAIFEYMQEQEE